MVLCDWCTFVHCHVNDYSLPWITQFLFTLPCLTCKEHVMKETLLEGVTIDNVIRFASNVMTNLPGQRAIILYILACDRSIHS